MQGFSQWLTVGMLLFVAVLAYWLFHKVKRIDRQLGQLSTKRDLNHLYRQLEALDALYRDLAFAKTLPPLRGYAGSPDFLLTLSGYVQERRPTHVLELGSGSSTLAIARTLQLCGSGRVISLDHEAKYAEKTAQLIKEHALDGFATVLHAPLIDHFIDGVCFHWYSLRDVPEIEFDMLAIDGPPESTQPMARYPALPLLASRLSANCVVVADDTNRGDETAMLQRWHKEFRDFVQESVPCEKGCVVLIRGQENQPLSAV